MKRAWLIVGLAVLGFGTLPVEGRAQLAFDCSYTVSPVLDFGAGTGLPTAQVDAVATVQVTCASLLNLARLRVCLSIPEGTGGLSVADRRMVLADRSIGYQLYRDSGRSVVWGTFGDALPVDFSFSVLNLPQSRTLTVYGRLPSGQSGQTVGDYASSLTPIVARRQSYPLLFGSAPSCSGVTGDPETLDPIEVEYAVEPSCSVTAQPLDFGTVAGVLVARTATSNLSVTCTEGGAWSIGLDGGTTTGDVMDRRMELGPGETLSYQLYRDAGHTLPWGTLPAVRVDGTGTGVAQSVPLYGLVPAQGLRPIGTYSDRVTVTVYY